MCTGENAHPGHVYDGNQGKLLLIWCSSPFRDMPANRYAATIRRYLIVTISCSCRICNISKVSEVCLPNDLRNGKFDCFYGLCFGT